MIIWVRNIVIILLILTAIYIALSTLSRYRKRQKLRNDVKAGQTDLPEDDYIARGMRDYERGLKPKLFIFVYLFPLAVMALLGYLAQYS
ncbi:hypothetical protein [Robiginitomaculum antarcticum]|uniref:hypothetical protein n=1 Tax=Robiginitomaculum antarcticum TaxID=437507 RepID=UPI000367D1C3|nr:hypothetical protein [Robiginitomaculum antarcticum]